jgi:hypothetical protein
MPAPVIELVETTMPMKPRSRPKAENAVQDKKRQAKGKKKATPAQTEAANQKHSKL